MLGTVMYENHIYLIVELPLGRRNEKPGEMLPLKSMQIHVCHLIYTFGQKLLKRKVGSITSTLHCHCLLF